MIIAAAEVAQKAGLRRVRFEAELKRLEKILLERKVEEKRIMIQKNAKEYYEKLEEEFLRN